MTTANFRFLSNRDYRGGSPRIHYRRGPAPFQRGYPVGSQPRHRQRWFRTVCPGREHRDCFIFAGLRYGGRGGKLRALCVGCKHGRGVKPSPVHPEEERTDRSAGTESKVLRWKSVVCRQSIHASFGYFSAGGLVTAVAPVVIKGKGIWVGWPGIHLDDPNEPIPESDPKDRTPTAGLLSKQVVAVHCERHLFEMFYNGCCNGTFWPLFHSMPDRAEFSADTWKVAIVRASLTIRRYSNEVTFSQAYVKVNQEFANKTMQALDTLKDENSSVVPTVWIHDYQLMICANWVRQVMA